MKASAGSSAARWRPASPASCTAPPDAAAPARFALEGRSRTPDPRTHAYRRDIADVALAGLVFAPHYVRPDVATVVAGAAMLREAPDAAARAVSQLLHGERFCVLDIAGDWAWGRCRHDDYVGYLPIEALGSATAPPTHRVTAPLALVFAAADIKAPVVAHRSLGALMAGREEGGFVACAEGWIARAHLAPAEERERDPVAVAERLIGQPYLWGGRGAGGIDCSGLVQLALGQCGIASPRDSDQQREALGRALGEDEPLARGDLLFFAGHVGLMVDGARLIHANAHHMAVTVEPLADVAARTPIVARRRLA